MQSCVLMFTFGALLAVVSAGCTFDQSGARPVAGECGHRAVAAGEIPVTGPGNCDKPGATYVLTKDVTSDKSAMFLGPDVTLDLNGYTISFVSGRYEHMRNGDFEQGFDGWDTSAAPEAQVVRCGGSWPFTGEYVCRMKAGDELVSPYVGLPVADRSYYGMVGVLTNYATLSVTVEDESGRAVEYGYSAGGRHYRTCPVEGKTNLDGGIVYAHFRKAPAGKYRLRIRAKDDASIDGVDIRPAGDVGVAVVGRTWLHSEYRNVVVDKHMPCFVDYTAEGSVDKPVDSIAVAKGGKGVTIRNGVIRNGFEGIQSWAVQAVGDVGTVKLENVKIVSAGINTNAVYAPEAQIRNCRFETDTPFIIERHMLKYSPVVIYRSTASEVSDCEFIGGQGNLCVIGSNAKVRGNVFVNRQRVVNHYALSLASARGVEVCENRFEPDIGCGINVYRSKDNDIHHNSFIVKAVDRNCAYYSGGGTMVGVRVSDYADRPNAPRGTWGNKVRDNTFRVLGKRHTTFGRGTGRACAIFSSTGAGVNYVTDNEIIVEHENPDSRSMAVAFYVGASPNAGVFAGNKVTSNVTPAYLGVSYGRVGKAVFRGNTFTKGPNAAKDYHPFAMGYWEATDIEFRSNVFEGSQFGIDWVRPDPKWERSTYDVWWTLRVKVVDPAGKVVPGKLVAVYDKDGKEAAKGKTNDDGLFQKELLAYSAVATRPTGDIEIDRQLSAPYAVEVGDHREAVELACNTEVRIVMD